MAQARKLSSTAAQAERRATINLQTAAREGREAFLRPDGCLDDCLYQGEAEQAWVTAYVAAAIEQRDVRVAELEAVAP
jgi:hypothetical protein